MEDACFFAELLGTTIYWDKGNIYWDVGTRRFLVNNIFDFREYLVDKVRELKQLNA